MEVSPRGHFDNIVSPFALDESATNNNNRRNYRGRGGRVSENRNVRAACTCFNRAVPQIQRDGPPPL